MIEPDNSEEMGDSEEFHDEQQEKSLNYTMYAEIPIIGSVVNHTNFFSGMDSKYKGINAH
jgi:hypothetical protein